MLLNVPAGVYRLRSWDNVGKEQYRVEFAIKSETSLQTTLRGPQISTLQEIRRNHFIGQFQMLQVGNQRH